MKMFIKILGGLAILVLLLVLVAFALPRQYRVERSIVLNARPAAVMDQLADLRAWKNWSAWHRRDPQMKLSYSTPTIGVGAWSAWESKREGNGKMTITGQSPGRIEYLLEFPEMSMKSNGSIALNAQGGGVRVVWVDAGDLGMNPLNRWVGLFLDKMIGPDFELGLANLKILAEK